MSDPRIAALAEALWTPYEPPHERTGQCAVCGDDGIADFEARDAAAAILAELPPDWCGHEVSQYDPDGIHVGWVPKSVVEAEIARLRKIEEAAQLAAREPFWCNWGAGQNAALDALRAALEAER